MTDRDKIAEVSISAMKLVEDYFKLYCVMRDYFLAHQDYDIPDEIKKALDL